MSRCNPVAAYVFSTRNRTTAASAGLRFSCHWVEACLLAHAKKNRSQNSVSIFTYVQVPHLQAFAFRKSAFAVRAQAENVQQDEGDSVDTSRLVSQFGGNSKFASVLAGALQRSGGEDVLTSGPERFEEPCGPCISSLISSQVCQIALATSHTGLSC